MLKGRTTYIAALAMAVAAVACHQAGMIDGAELSHRLTEAAAIAGLRRGMASGLLTMLGASSGETAAEGGKPAVDRRSTAWGAVLIVGLSVGVGGCATVSPEARASAYALAEDLPVMRRLLVPREGLSEQDKAAASKALEDAAYNAQRLSAELGKP